MIENSRMIEAFAPLFPVLTQGLPKTHREARRTRAPTRMQRVASPAPPAPKAQVQPLRTITNPPPARPSPKQPAVALPQDMNPSERARRQQTVLSQRQEYEWTYDAIKGTALIDSLPVSENPNRRWVVMMKRISDRVQKNTAAIQPDFRPLEDPNESSSPTGYSHELESDPDSFSDPQTQYQDSPDEFQRFKNQFATIDKSTITDDNQFLTDELFGWYRIAGPNPMQIRRYMGDLRKDFQQLSDELFRKISHFKDDSLQTAMKEHRLYIVDYAVLKDFRTGSYPDGSSKDGLHLYAPKALLAVPKENSLRACLLPVAIHCSQDPTEDMFTPVTSHTSPSQWSAAKHTVQVADAFVHETVQHFGRTHLLMEVFVCATHRSLPPTHPLFKLLNCHFEGTAFINDSSLKTLISPGGLIDNITAPSIEHTQALAAGALGAQFRFNDSMPDVELRDRGVTGDADGDDNTQKQPLHFPYRDDALMLWEAILQWVGEFIRSFYKSDNDVRADYELQNWCGEIIHHGRIQGFGEPTGDNSTQVVPSIWSREYLTRAVSMIIFTASVQHAAVNFPQVTHMQFAPAMPLAGYAEAPSRDSTGRRCVGSEELRGEHCIDKVEGHNEEHDVFMRMMPDLTNAHRQLCAAEMLGAGRYTKLGQYGRRLDFANANLQNALSRFQDRLEHVECCIQARNREEGEVALPLYDFLIPSAIPQSVNV